MSRWSLFLTVSCGCLLAGCEAQPKSKPAAPTSTTTPTKATASADSTEKPATKAAEPAGDEITVQFIDAEGFQAAVAKHPGKVVLVDCWATWCLPCIQGFPATVAMSKKFADQGLVIISLSFDDPTNEQTKAKVTEFLRKQEATFENYVSKLDLDTDGGKAFAVDGLPHYKLYDRSGKLLKTFNADPDQGISHEVLEAAVEEALK